MKVSVPRPPIVHELKIWPTYFDAILRGDKTHEIRNADRGFRVGDTLRLNEFYPGDERFSGRSIDVEVSYLADESSPHGVPGRVLMSVRLKLPTYHEMVEALKDSLHALDHTEWKNGNTDATESTDEGEVQISQEYSRLNAILKRAEAAQKRGS